MSEWIKWRGGDCPVDTNAYVDVILRDGARINSTRAGDRRWNDWGDKITGMAVYDIVLYRLAEPIKKGGSSPNQYRKSLTLPLTEDRSKFAEVDLEVMDICQAWGFQQEEHNVLKAFSRNGIKDSGDRHYDARKVLLFSLQYAKRQGLINNQRFWELIKEMGLE